jgi:hypothetical protein
MLETQLILVEGIMGSGKSSTARFLARQIRRHHYSAVAITEATRNHPTNVMRALPHWKHPWLDLTADELLERSYQKWRTFVTRARQSHRIYVFDGQLFHGDFTSLFLMNCSSVQLSQYMQEVLQLAQPLQPMMIYLYQRDVANALERMGRQRGEGWITYQVDWKTNSPYCQEHGLCGKAGWISLYKEYRALTDTCFNQITLRKLAIENSTGQWDEYLGKILDFIQISPIPERFWEHWFYPMYDYVKDRL